MPPATARVVALELFADPDDWGGAFDRLEVWRSRLTEKGPYLPISGDGWSPARVPESATALDSLAEGPLVPIVGLALDLLVNETRLLSITFIGIHFITTAMAADQVQSQSGGLLRAYVDPAGQLVIETLEPGQGASLRVVGGAAAPLLRLPTEEPDSLSYGRDPSVALILGRSRYGFTDVHGDAGFFYKTRFYNTLDGSAGEFSAPFTGASITALSTSAMVLGVIDIVGPDGVATANQEVLVYARFQGQLIESKTIAGGALKKRTNEAGHVEFLLPRGLAVSVCVAGTNLVRDVIVPTDPSLTVFNLLDPTRGTNDVFTVQYPHIDYAARSAI